jgi:hypothetical protein
MHCFSGQDTASAGALIYPNLLPSVPSPDRHPITTYPTRFANAFSSVINEFPNNYTVPKAHFCHQDARYRGAMQSATRPLTCSQLSPEVIR